MDSSRLEAPSLRILDGDCWVFFALDIGYAIDLDAAESLLSGPTSPTGAVGATGSGGDVRPGESDCPAAFPHPGAGGNAPQRAGQRGGRRVPASFRFRPAPLRIDQPAPEAAKLDLGGFHALPAVECTLFDFGAVSVAYRIALRGREPTPRGGGVEARRGLAVDDLLPLARALFDCAPLAANARQRAAALASRLAGAIERPAVAEIVEDYAVYHVRVWEGGAAGSEAALRADAPAIARLLLAEDGPVALAPATVESALAARVSYAASDVAVIDWNAAIVLGQHEADTLAVLEFANVQLLEMRFLDDRLDAALDRSYATLLRRDARGRPPRSPLGLIFDPHRAERRRLAALQMESAVLFEGVNNAIQLVGDQHLARVYAAAAKRFHLAEWDRSILRKLHTIDGLYQKLSDEQANRRMEVLEWIIILLIAVSIVLPLLPGIGK